VKSCFWAGKTLTLALLSVSLAACGNGLPFGGQKADGATLQSSVSDPQVRAFYQARQWKSAWDKKNTKTLLAIIAQAPSNGLKPDLFLKQPLPRDANEREAMLTNAAVRYASALARGYADPNKISAVYTIPRPNPDIAGGLANALAKGDLEDWYASLPPQTDEYRALSEEHLRYLRQAANVRLEPIPAGKPVKPGHRDPRIKAIASALSAKSLRSCARGGGEAAAVRLEH